MGTVTTGDGTTIFYKDWGQGQPVLFSHGWPLNADAWDDQAMLVADNGYRAIAHDRRGHGRSSQPWDGNDLDTYADDLAQLLDALEVRDAVLVGHSTGGGEVTRYLGRHGTTRVAKAVLVPGRLINLDRNGRVANPDQQGMEVADHLPVPTTTATLAIHPRHVSRSPERTREIGMLEPSRGQRLDR